MKIISSSSKNLYTYKIMLREVKRIKFLWMLTIAELNSRYSCVCVGCLCTSSERENFIFIAYLGFKNKYFSGNYIHHYNNNSFQNFYVSRVQIYRSKSSFFQHYYFTSHSLLQLHLLQADWTFPGIFDYHRTDI